MAHFHRYGGRGIKVCERWHQFENFVADMGHPPDKYTLERVNGDGNYSPENCKWATRKEQANNTARNVWMTYQGETLTLSQWADKTGVSYTTVLGRYKYGWPPEKVLATTPQRNGIGGLAASKVSAANRKAKTHCKHGHERTPENVYLQKKDGKVIRKSCKVCLRIYKRRRKTTDA